MKNSDSTSTSGATSESQPTKPDLWGFDLYPERRGNKYQPTWAGYLWFGEGRREYDKIRCEKNVYACIQKSPLVKLMANALKSSGCNFDIRRHVSCEVCDISVTGGYDQELNQIVVCQNSARKEGMVQGVLAHEMIHMFDYCRNDLDFKNIDHLACTEIRAANLTHCSFFSAMFQGDATPFSVKKAHQRCVKKKAAMSVMAVRNMSESEAMKAVNKVFDKCYSDLEPIGRRLRRNSNNMQLAYDESFLYGYGW